MDKRLLDMYTFLYKLFLFAFLANVLFFFLSVEQVEQSKQVKGVTNLDNPSEIIKNAQRELVMNNSSTKEENKKG